MPLYRLMHKNPMLQWHKEVDDTLHTPKEVMLVAPMLAAPTNKEPMLVYVVASERVVSDVMVVE